MSLRNCLGLSLALSALALLAACGNSGSGTVNPVPPPSGSFSNSNLNGTYVFSVSGIDLNGAPYALLGTFTANGQGGITAGTIDINDADLSAPVPNSAISGSNGYSVTVDGRGEISLGTSALGTITLDFVLQDSSHGLVTEFDSNATGSGTIDLQSSGVSPVGTYAFSLAGEDYSSGTNANLFATVGNFTVGSGGAISGLVDFNDSQFAYTNQALSGSLVLGPSSTPSTTLSATFPSNTFGVPLTCDVIAIDASHLKVIEMDTFANLIGDAYAQTSGTFPSGTLAFTMAGSYPTATNASAAGGFIVTDGAGNITSSSTADSNNTGTVSPSPVTFSGSYATAGAGRYTVSLAGFSDGTQYVAYPYNNGVFLLETDNNGVMIGAAFPQTQNTLAGSQGYALNFTGVNLTDGVEVDDIAEFATNTTGLTVTGVVDENYQPSGSPNQGLALSGTYTTPDSNGRGGIGANAGSNSNSTLNGGFDITYYSVDGTTFPFIETDANGQVTSGVFVEQSSSASSAARPHLFVVKPFARPRSSFRKK
ncbi:MAG TPA: hypothetical protein VMF66_14680 [Candidatus Acidoferrum sp.]|nr:hypothetical protein [Candidatus Acidoferrum sp.]HTZ83242.1 hypothetical protein [Candidatus Acidoferrales bacterium]